MYTWFDLIGMLVGAGHSIQSVGEMTLPAFEGFLKAIYKQEAIKRTAFIADVALGSRAEGVDIERTIKMLLRPYTAGISPDIEDCTQYFTG